MNSRKSPLLLSALVLLASTGAAYAGNGNFLQVWRDSEGQIVHNSWGTCVRGQWVNDEDACRGPRRTAELHEDRTVYFAFNKANLSPDAREELDSLTTPAAAVEEAHIVGYADRIGTVSYNEALSKKRADTVRDYLEEHKIIKRRDTKTHWVGKSKPTAECSSDLPHAKLVECLQPDRKVTVDIDYKGEFDADGDQANDE